MILSPAIGLIKYAAPGEAQSFTDLCWQLTLFRRLFILPTLRKRKPPSESMNWLAIGIAIFKNLPLSQIVNLMICWKKYY